MERLGDTGNIIVLNGLFQKPTNCKSHHQKHTSTESRNPACSEIKALILELPVMTGSVSSLFQRFSFSHSLRPFSASLGALAFHLEKNTAALLSPLILSLFAGTATFGSGGLQWWNNVFFP